MVHLAINREWENTRPRRHEMYVSGVGARYVVPENAKNENTYPSA